MYFDGMRWGRFVNVFKGLQRVAGRPGGGFWWASGPLKLAGYERITLKSLPHDSDLLSRETFRAESGVQSLNQKNPSCTCANQADGRCSNATHLWIS